jgi:hypothetical protein
MKFITVLIIFGLIICAIVVITTPSGNGNQEFMQVASQFVSK